MARKPDFTMALYASRHHDHNIFDDLRFSGAFDAVAVYYTDEPKKRPWVWRRGVKFGAKMLENLKGFNFWVPGDAPPPAANGKPCFVLQDLDPKGTLFAPWNERVDDGSTTAALRGRHDCIVFSAGTGHPLTDERSIVQGDFGFTAVNVGSIERTTPIPGRDRMDEATALGRNVHSYLVVSVFGTKVEIERHDYVSSNRKPFAPVWTVDIAKYGGYEYAARTATAGIPQFADGAKMTVTEEPGGQVELAFPAAKAVMGARPYEYEVTARHIVTNLEIVDGQKRIYSPDFASGPASDLKEVRCFFQRADLVWDVETVFDVRPMNCFGGKGAAISGSVYLESPGEREIRMTKEAKQRKAAKKGVK